MLTGLEKDCRADEESRAKKTCLKHLGGHDSASLVLRQTFLSHNVNLNVWLVGWLVDIYSFSLVLPWLLVGLVDLRLLFMTGWLNHQVRTIPSWRTASLTSAMARVRSRLNLQQNSLPRLELDLKTLVVPDLIMIAHGCNHNRHLTIAITMVRRYRDTLLFLHWSCVESIRRRKFVVRLHAEALCAT